MGEVDDLGRLVDHHQAQRDERVDRPDGDAIQRQLQNLDGLVTHVRRAGRGFPPWIAAFSASEWRVAVYSSFTQVT
jgi:hypothetical protein